MSADNDDAYTRARKFRSSDPSPMDGEQSQSLEASQTEGNEGDGESDMIVTFGQCGPVYARRKRSDGR